MGVLRFINRLSVMASRILMYAGGAVMLVMIFLTCSNIFLRAVWVPVPGTYELMGYFGAVIAAFAMGMTQIRRGHVAVDVLVNTFPKPVVTVLHTLNSLISFLFFAFIAWEMAKKARTLWVAGEVTETLRIIYYPFVYAVALGLAILSLALLNDLLEALFAHKGGEA